MKSYPYEVMQALRLSRGLDNDDESQDKELLEMCFEDVIFEYLKCEVGSEASDQILEVFENLLDANFNEVQRRLDEYQKMKKEQDERFFELTKSNIKSVLEDQFSDKISGFSEEQMNRLLNNLVISCENFASCDLDGVVYDILSNVFDEVVSGLES